MVPKTKIHSVRGRGRGKGGEGGGRMGRAVSSVMTEGASRNEEGKEKKREREKEKGRTRAKDTGKGRRNCFMALPALLPAPQPVHRM